MRGIKAEVAVAHLVAQGTVPSEVREERPALEEMFLQLTEAQD